MLAAEALRLLFSPVGKIGLAVLALVAWTAYQRADATADCRDAQLAKELAAANEALTRSAGIVEGAERRADDAQSALEKLGRDKDALLRELESKGSSCTLDPAVRERLRLIR